MRMALNSGARGHLAKGWTLLRQNLGIEDEVDVDPVEAVTSDGAEGYVERRRLALGTPSIVEELAVVEDEVPEAVRKAKLLVARAQRSVRSKADNDTWLRSQLAALSNDAVNGLISDIFSESE